MSLQGATAAMLETAGVKVAAEVIPIRRGSAQRDGVAKTIELYLKHDITTAQLASSMR
ncbi:hypothetical protein [Pelomonas aquatica]|jgi:hypothetical protein|nr:hypothetical protein [Pelomonas aquatica]MCY4754110.1 hypothetical protein [Pelomonas aquatica]